MKLSRFENTFVCVLLSIHAGMLLWSACSQSPVLDEFARLRAGFEHLERMTFEGNLGNPPLCDTAAAVTASVFSDGRAVGDLKFEPQFVLNTTFGGRVSILIFAAVAAVGSYQLARDIFGKPAAICVLLLCCMDPLMMAHGSLITGDMCATAAGVAGMYAFWKWMRQPSLPGAVLCGIALGCVLLSKYVWIVMPILWAALWIARRLTSPALERWPLPGHLAVMGLLAAYVINVGYVFESTFQPWRTFQFASPTLQQFAVDPDAADGVAGWLGAIPVPLPRHYIMGIDPIADHVQTEVFPTYVRGRFHTNNVWWFHVYGLLVKMPLGTWLLLTVALYARLTMQKRQGENPEPLETEATSRNARSTMDSTGMNFRSTAVFEARHWFTDLVLWLPALTILVFVSWVTQVKLLRYILPMLPFAFIWIGHAFVWAQQGRWWRKSIVYGALGWTVLSSLWVYPHSLSYFNEAAGGTDNGHAHLIWASNDWGQGLLYLKDWVEQHPEAQPLHLRCYASIDPESLGIDSRRPPPFGPQPGWYAISASILRGIQRPRPVGNLSNVRPHPLEYLEQFLNEEPVDRVACSIFIYHLDCDQANAMRSKLGQKLLNCPSDD